MVIDPLGVDKIDKPIVSVVVNLDDIMHEAVNLLQMINGEIRSITTVVNEHVNSSMDTTVTDVVDIVENVKTITGNLAQTTGTFYQPIFIAILLFLFLLILLVLFLLFVLKTRREYKKRPFKFVQRYRRYERNARVEPRHRRSTSTLPATTDMDGFGQGSGAEKKRNDTLV